MPRAAHNFILQLLYELSDVTMISIVSTQPALRQGEEIALYAFRTTVFDFCGSAHHHNFNRYALASEHNLEHVRHQQLLAIGVVAAAQHDGLEGRDARGDGAAPPHGRPRLGYDPHLAHALLVHVDDEQRLLRVVGLSDAAPARDAARELDVRAGAHLRQLHARPGRLVAPREAERRAAVGCYAAFGIGAPVLDHLDDVE